MHQALERRRVLSPPPVLLMEGLLRDRHLNLHPSSASRSLCPPPALPLLTSSWESAEDCGVVGHLVVADAIARAEPSERLPHLPGVSAPPQSARMA
eukprot:757742-Hanusia_phi.AAC.2